MKSLEYKVMLWKPDDDELTGRLVTALQNVFKDTKRTIESFLWKHRENPNGTSIIAYAEHMEDQRIMALRAFWKVNLVLNGKVIPSYQPCDTATLPDYQRMGLFTKLTNEALKLSQEEGVQMIFNFPVSNSKAGYIKLGWQDSGGMQWYVKPINKKNLFKYLLSSKGKFGNFVAINGNRKKNKKVNFNHISELAVKSVLKEKEILRGERSVSLYKWRFDDNPLKEYEYLDDDVISLIFIIGARGYLKELQILDIQMESSMNVFQRFRSAVNLVAYEYGADIVGFLVAKKNPIHSMLFFSGFIPIPTQANMVYREIQENIINPNTKIALTAADIDTY